ncbi:MAG: PHP domain-containing protein [Spongiibacteraceae bacterium]
MNYPTAASLLADVDKRCKRVDLHCHTNASDGNQTPAQLCLRAVELGVDVLAITDHDTAAGFREAHAFLDANPQPLQLIPAAEFSCVWRNISVHVVGLGIDIEHPAALEAFTYLQAAREQRAVMIDAKLAKLRMPGTYDGAKALAGAAQVGRPHFARFMVERGYVSSVDAAFNRYLGAGKIGDIKVLWPTLEQVVGWINAAGGVAVLAHPLKYRLTATRLRLLVAEFKAAGGMSMEVVTGRQQQDWSFLAQLCQQNGLEASQGSDFHGPGLSWGDLGQIARMPAGCTPVWRRWLEGGDVSCENADDESPEEAAI